mgnify:CR=1 FL=1
MALGEICSFLGFLLFLGLIFPLLEIIIIILSPQLYIKKDNPYSQVADLKNSRRYTEENSFADAILWADVGNDL